jgi:hypothetical protein
LLQRGEGIILKKIFTSISILSLGAGLLLPSERASANLDPSLFATPLTLQELPPEKPHEEKYFEAGLSYEQKARPKTLHRFDIDIDEICGRHGGLGSFDRELTDEFCAEADDLTGSTPVFLLHEQGTGVHLSSIETVRMELSKNGEDQLSRKYNTLTAVMGIMFNAVLFVPESLGGWTQDRKDRIKSSVGGAWTHNLKQGLVMDKDPAFINYVLHPYSGAAYYMLVRKSGYSPLVSFAFSVLMSTQWEILEVIGEPLSIQDLWATPVLGSLFGEIFYQIHEVIASHEEFAKSALGKAILFLVDPVEGVSKGVDFMAKKVFHPKARGHLEIFFGDVEPTRSRIEFEGMRLDSPKMGARLRFDF